MNNKMVFRRFKLLTTSFYIRFVALLMIPLIYADPLLACGNPPEKTAILIGQFSKGSTQGWTPIVFSKLTRYELVDLDNAKVLRADSHGAASGLIYKQKIDLLKTPLLNWCWRVEQVLQNDHEQGRSSDDFAARLYLVIDGGFMPWKTRALNYVWSSQLPVGELWKNPYAGKSAMMLAVRSNTSPGKIWFAETRNVYEDLEHAFGHKIRYIDAVAIMTDTDNTDSTAQTYYGDIYFSVP